MTGRPITGASTGRPITGASTGRPTSDASNRRPSGPARALAEPARRSRTARRGDWASRLERAALRGTGTALALAAAGTGDGTVTDRLGPVGLLPVAVGALWAAVPAPDGPAARTWPARLSAARTTLLCAGSVLLAALGEPSWWRALAVTVLLAAHLLLLDALGPGSPTIRPAAAATALTASLLVLPPAFAPTGAGEWSRPFALLGLVTAAAGVGLALRSDRTQPPAAAEPRPDPGGPARPREPACPREPARRRPARRRH
ncbi:hypothetical protein GCM10018790_52230 [Kitasatospora xanthocidica]|uniref:hypothetical protein n=1 Tax=Kitasatospora xanthocidica TaxID=83382 RepID=UPI00167A3069|nr:hypothetical protein [Kitasatospora xanthocidica]GHF67812.1 hypothetical protein GCM10018790_52230 [Kitasatospora xanthocidica]